ncbi:MULTISPECIES: L-glutamate gamma-semialdehyde dehydrogenase [Oceanobacillus]|uniref:1-pyrroline-5-carboxylate dehydrogenase n=1 Tax=Oceanobacillus kimchii TaxID=746691 RepID=A0ABQ5TFY9_9BACI|nr:MULTISPECIES: L-glutamate gamma-semialdehyde dehydrogenase [Oceanobacillus]MBT2598914.1 L-glutamate gamma-semialdehyde dehydrogenase [Oceanobacillus sp. ISL-74]MBT2651833.1 L-glutamate gamma-semialdehyde dehydrogenase [Oceanobacillus sp. ISL-73]OEH54467.1 1-pyrroline-5-carboxylate dehydrogenase [Oceanobacillus sp. E9]GLO65793.1 L-glutamate gamma-semialdehyde dehydrogenase [Oceanobacillus kimchii]
MVLPFKHEPFTDFTVEENRKDYQAALAKVKGELGKDYPLVINGEKIYTDDKLVSVNPSNKKEVVGQVSKATQQHIEEAFSSSKEAFKEWKTWSAEDRARVLYRAAAIVRRRKHEFSAWLSYDAGKPWDQADGDTAEGIDFLEYYARHMVELEQGKPLADRPNEDNKYFYQPMGPGVVIPPWNFAFAIVCGTTVAPIVAGNPVLLKPSENTPVIAYKLVEVLEEAGLPKGVLNFVPGDPAEIGDYLVDHKDTHFINFTGSRATGVRIFERATKIQDGQTHLKRVVAEMGGKDTIIVDESADLDLAAESIVHSAFGFSGQKCSACSRAVIHESVYDEVIKKSVELTKTLTVGNPTEDNVYMASVVNQKQFDKIKDYIEVGKQEGELVFGGETDDSKGFFVHPTIFKDLDPQARIMQEEIFGPVVAFAKAKDFDELLDIANNTEYGLTGAVISNNRENLNRAQTEFLVGNLYFNRGCTAAIVGYQPFGGFKMSGTDSKAGGPDYLQHFLNAKVVTERF